MFVTIVTLSKWQRRPFLPPAFRRNEEGNVFTGVCPFTPIGGGYPHLTDRVGYPLPRSGQGVPWCTPSQQDGVTPPRPGQDEEYPLPRYGQGGTPSQVRMGGYPRVCPVSRMSPPIRRMGYPQLSRSQVMTRGYPQLEQLGMYLLCGGRYVSCVHAGGLSCCKVCEHRHVTACLCSLFRIRH